MFLLREPPHNGGYMLAAYLIVGVVLLGYSLSLMARARKEEQREKNSVNSER
jgi:hypothetical protein